MTVWLDVRMNGCLLALLLPPPTMLCCVVAVVLCLFVVGPDSRTGFVHLVGMGSRRASNKPSPLSALFIVSLLLCSLLSRKSALSSSTQSPNVLYFVRLFCFGLVHPSSLVASAGILATKPHERIQSICSIQTQQPTIWERVFRRNEHRWASSWTDGEKRAEQNKRSCGNTTFNNLL